MLNKRAYEHYWASDIFDIIQEKTGEDWQSEMMEYWGAICDTSIMFYVDTNGYNVDDKTDLDKICYYVSFVLVENGCQDKTTVYLDF